MNGDKQNHALDVLNYIVTVVHVVHVEIRRSRVQIPFRPLTDVVLGSPEFRLSATLVTGLPPGSWDS